MSILPEIDQVIRLYNCSRTLPQLLDYARKHHLGKAPGLSRLSGQGYMKSVGDLVGRKLATHGVADEKLSLLLFTEWLLDKRVVRFSGLQDLALSMTEVEEVPLDMLRRFPAPAVAFEFDPEMVIQGLTGIIVSVIDRENGALTLAATTLGQGRRLCNWVTLYPGESWGDVMMRTLNEAKRSSDALALFGAGSEEAREAVGDLNDGMFSFASRPYAELMTLALNCALYLIRYGEYAAPPLQPYAGVPKKGSAERIGVQRQDLGHEFDARLSVEEISAEGILYLASELMLDDMFETPPDVVRYARPSWRKDARGELHWSSFVER